MPSCSTLLLLRSGARTEEKGGEGFGTSAIPHSVAEGQESGEGTAKQTLAWRSTQHLDSQVRDGRQNSLICIWQPWNTRSLTCERFEYCKSLKYDILALTELWRNQAKYQNRSKQFIVSEPKIIKKGPRKGQPRFPDDRAAGVAIMFSAAAQKKVLAFGSEGERICWVRLRGPSYLLSVRDRNLPTT